MRLQNGIAINTYEQVCHMEEQSSPPAKRKRPREVDSDVYNLKHQSLGKHNLRVSQGLYESQLLDVTDDTPIVKIEPINTYEQVCHMEEQSYPPAKRKRPREVDSDVYNLKPQSLGKQNVRVSQGLFEYQLLDETDDTPIVKIEPSDKIVEETTSTQSSVVISSMQPGDKFRGMSSTCRLCSKTFDSKNKLMLHMVEHPGEKAFVCEICSKEFRNNSNFWQHRRKHSTAAFSCPLCSKAFQYSSTRLRHILTQACTRLQRHLHHTAHGWECLTCTSAPIPSRRDAENHARRHLTGKGMPCPVCDQIFPATKQNALISHVRQQHMDYIPSLGL